MAYSKYNPTPKGLPRTGHNKRMISDTSGVLHVVPHGVTVTWFCETCDRVFSENPETGAWSEAR